MPSVKRPRQGTRRRHDDTVNPFQLSGRWYKANLHTHTDKSDGAVSLEHAVATYRKQGYDVLALTDHGLVNDVRGLSDKKMLVISGIEYHPPVPGRNGPYHFVGLNVPRTMDLSDCRDAQAAINAVKRAGGETFLAHPFWCGLEYADFGNLEGLIAVEVWNAVCSSSGRGSSENEWAYALDRGMNLPAVAVDDTHWRPRGGKVDIFGGWTWLKMPSLTAANVMKAMRRGAFYASAGPRIHEFRVEDGKASVRCSSAAEIHFVSGPGQGMRRAAPEGKSVRSFTMQLPNSWPFVRAVVTDQRGRKAWTNPIRL